MCGFGTQNVGTDLSFFTQSRTVGAPTTIRITQSIPTLLARNGAAPRNDAGTKRLGSCRVYGTTRLHVNAFGRIYVLFRRPDYVYAYGEQSNVHTIEPTRIEDEGWKLQHTS